MNEPDLNREGSRGLTLEGVDKPSTVAPAGLGCVGGARDDYGRIGASTKEGKGRVARVKEAAVLRNLELEGDQCTSVSQSTVGENPLRRERARASSRNCP